MSTADVFNAQLSGEPACSFFGDGADHGHPGPYNGRPSDDPKHFFCRFCMQEHTEPQPDAPTSATARAAHLDVANAERFPPDLRFNDIDNSTRFVHLHGDRIRYVIEWGVWLVWNGLRWVIDRNNVAVHELAKSVSSALYQQAAEDTAAAKITAGWANRSATRGGIASMVHLSRGMEGVVISHTELDADPWSLGVRNGYIDLHDGTHHPADPAKLMTMHTPIPYNPDAEAPRWDRALAEWFPDQELREYVQRVSGHALSGDPLGDHIFVIQHGDGRNGKGTYNRAHKHVLGPYYVTPDKSLLIQKRHDEHATVKARLFRTRLAVASETEQRERLNEAQVKNLTGRDPINARRMREDEWEFEPSHSLWLQTNYLPEVTGSDNGMWSRIRVVPFTETFTGRGDPELDTTLAAETPGILNWMIEGCLQWQRIGLEEPESVTRATLEYRAAEDVLTRFAADIGLEFVKGTNLADADLKNHIADWAAEEGVDKPTAKKINAWMKAQGCREGRENYTKLDGKTSKRKIWKGASLPRPSAYPPSPTETQAIIEETPLPGRTGPTLPVNRP